jgi:hypothetical protein
MVAQRRQGNSQPGDEGPGRSAAASRQERRLKSQAWFWTADWQAKEREADESLAAGRVRRFLNEQEFLEELEAVDAEERTKDADPRPHG